MPLPVLERMRDEMLDYRGTGMSVMEMSHRSAEFEAINDKTEQSLRRVMGIPDDYAVLFLQGGGSLQFAMVPMNLYVPGKPVDMIHTGAWTAKAIEELKKFGEHRLAASTEADNFTRVPRPSEISLKPDASYVYLCTNNTIEGTQWDTLPDTAGVPLAGDMSSDMLSRPTSVGRFGLIFAGAQKNLGPSGVTVVIIRRDLAERADAKLAKILQYRTYVKERSLYNTPPTFAVYAVGLVLDWIEAEGGAAGMIADGCFDQLFDQETVHLKKRSRPHTKRAETRLIIDRLDRSHPIEEPLRRTLVGFHDVHLHVGLVGEQLDRPNEARELSVADLFAQRCERLIQFG